MTLLCRTWELHDAMVLHLDTTHQVDMRLSFVTLKKNRKRRAIFACRPTHKRLECAPRTVLGPVESWARLGLNAGENMKQTQRRALQNNIGTSQRGRDRQHQCKTDRHSSSDMFVAEDDVRDFLYQLAINGR